MKYWYFWRNDTPLWFDEDGNKWINASTTHARDTIYSWWNADADLLGMMLLKIDHMFYKLKKDGNHTWQYLDSFIFNEKYVTKSDKEWAMKQALKSLIDPKAAKDDYRVDKSKVKGTTYYSRWIGNVEEFDGHELDVLEGKVIKGMELTEGMKQRLEELRELRKSATSESGLVHYYITHVISPTEDYYIVESTTDKIAVKDYYSTLEFKKKKMDFIPNPSYKTKERKTLLRFTTFKNFCDIDTMLEEYLGKDKPIFSSEANFLMDQQTFEVKNEDFKILSPKVRAQVRGRRQDLIHLLQVRRALKKILNHSDYEDKYNTWCNNENLNDKERRKELLKCRKLYEDDRRKYDRELADILAKYGETFWD